MASAQLVELTLPSLGPLGLEQRLLRKLRTRILGVALLFYKRGEVRGLFFPLKFVDSSSRGSSASLLLSDQHKALAARL